MSSEDTSDEHLTRNKVKSSGVTLSWNKELGSNNPVLASTSQAELLDLPVVQQDIESGTVNLSEPADEFLPQDEEELAWDHSGDIESPPAGLQSPDIVIDTNLENTINASKWSTGINRALTPDSRNISPERITLRSRLQGTSSEPDTSDQDRSESEVLDTGKLDHTVGGNMDEEAYKKRSFQFKKLFRDVEDSISDFSEQDVFIQNVDSCEPLLAQIKNKFMALRSSLREFYDEFESDAHPDWEEEWEKSWKICPLNIKRMIERLEQK